MRRPRDAVYYLTGPGSFTPWPRDAMYYTQATRKAFGFGDSYPGAARTSQLLGPPIRKFRKGGKNVKNLNKTPPENSGCIFGPFGLKKVGRFTLFLVFQKKKRLLAEKYSAFCEIKTKQFMGSNVPFTVPSQGLRGDKNLCY